MFNKPQGTKPSNLYSRASTSSKTHQPRVELPTKRTYPTKTCLPESKKHEFCWTILHHLWMIFPSELKLQFSSEMSYSIQWCFAMGTRVSQWEASLQIPKNSQRSRCFFHEIRILWGNFFDIFGELILPMFETIPYGSKMIQSYLLI